MGCGGIGESGTNFITGPNNDQGNIFLVVFKRAFKLICLELKKMGFN
jgi:hypothetical protein